MIKFEEMGFTPGILKAIQELGFEKPVPVQKKVIPLVLGDGIDIIALTQTGTGNTDKPKQGEYSGKYRVRWSDRRNGKRRLKEAQTTMYKN